MGELTGPPQPSAAFAAEFGYPGQYPPPWPGMPRSLEALSVAERLSWGHRFAVDGPAYMTPSGFGEMIPLLPGESPPRYVLPYPEGPLKPAPRALKPHVGLRPHAGLFPTARGYIGA